MIGLYYGLLAQQAATPSFSSTIVSISGQTSDIGLWSGRQRQQTKMYDGANYYFGASIAPFESGRNTDCGVVKLNDNDTASYNFVTDAVGNDYHQEPGFWERPNGDWYMYQEEIHADVISIWKSTAGLDGVFTRLAEQTPDYGIAYTMMFDTPSGNQGFMFRSTNGITGINQGLAMLFSNNGGEGWGTLPPVKIADRQTSIDLDRIYPWQLIGGMDQIGGYQYFIFSYRQDGVNTHWAYGAFKIPVSDLDNANNLRIYTCDGSDTLVGTVSTTTSLTNTQRDQLLLYTADAGSSKNLGFMISCVDDSGNIYTTIKEDFDNQGICKNDTYYELSSDLRGITSNGFYPVKIDGQFWRGGYLYFWLASDGWSVWDFCRCEDTLTNFELLHTISGMPQSNPPTDTAINRIDPISQPQDMPNDKWAFLNYTGSSGAVSSANIVILELL